MHHHCSPVAAVVALVPWQLLHSLPLLSPSPPRPLPLQGYGNQDESDYEDGGYGGNGAVMKDKLSAKHKSRTISINPTEGFQYSDVYFVSRMWEGGEGEGEEGRVRGR